MFLEKVNESIPVLMQLLGSKNSMETKEAVQLFFILKKLNIQRADEGIKKMAVLVFKKNEKETQDVSEIVVEKYFQIYRDDQDVRTAKNLIDLITSASLTELFCYEEIIKRFCKYPQFLN